MGKRIHFLVLAFATCLLGAAASAQTGPAAPATGAVNGSGLVKKRWVVERRFAWLHQFKRLRTRYERRADLHLAPLNRLITDEASSCHEPPQRASSDLRMTADYPGNAGCEDRSTN